MGLVDGYAMFRLILIYLFPRFKHQVPRKERQHPGVEAAIFRPV